MWLSCRVTSRVCERLGHIPDLFPRFYLSNVWQELFKQSGSSMTLVGQTKAIVLQSTAETLDNKALGPIGQHLGPPQNAICFTPLVCQERVALLIRITRFSLSD